MLLDRWQSKSLVLYGWMEGQMGGWVAEAQVKVFNEYAKNGLILKIQVYNCMKIKF